MASPLFDPHLEADLMASGIVAVLVIDDVNDAVPLARALLEGGIGAMELAFRTPTALDALRAIRCGAPGMVAGVGTILTCDQLSAAHDAGAAFGVAPGCNPRLLAAARQQRFSFAPGIATATDIETALEHGCCLLKIFPVEQLGGLACLRAMAAPYAHLCIRYLPLGGLTEANAQSYLQDPLVAAIGGSWIAPREAIRANEWEAITARARTAKKLVESRQNLVRTSSVVVPVSPGHEL